MKIDYHSKFEVRYSISRLVFILVFVAATFTWLGFAYHGDVSMLRHQKPGKESEVLAALFIIAGIPIFCWNAYKIIKINPLKPPLTLSPDGFVYRAFSTNIVPWTLVVAVDVRRFKTRRSAWTEIKLSLAKDIPDHFIRAARQADPFSTQPRAISIPTRQFTGPGSGEIAAIVKHYYALYGTERS